MVLTAQQLVDDCVAEHLAEPSLCLRLAFGGNEVDAERGAAEHELGVDVGVAGSHTEVERVTCGADDRAARDGLPLDDRVIDARNE